MTHRRQSAVKLLAAIFLLCTLSASAAQIKGAWVQQLGYHSSGTGIPESAGKIAKMTNAQLTTAFLYINSTDLRRGGWDAQSNFVSMALASGIATYFWYPPWNDGRQDILANPTFAVRAHDGTYSETDMCFNRPEVRDFELNLLTNLPITYPALAGIDLGEPYLSADYCYCPYCTNFFWTNCAMNIMASPPNLAATQAVVYCAANLDFLSRLRASLIANRVGFKLTCDGSPNDGSLSGKKRYGEDWMDWGPLGLIDFYLPQIYTSNTNTFVTRLAATQSALASSVPTVPGVSIVSFMLTNTPTVVGQEVRFGYNLGGGFSLFQADDLTTAYEQAVVLSTATNILVRAKNLRIKNVVIR